MRLGTLIHSACPDAVFDTMDQTGMDMKISALSTDSRTITPGALFIASDAGGTDGHQFMAHAQENGASAVVAERNPDQLPGVILVTDTQKACAAIADLFYGSPSKEMVLIGVTGTNGKTTVTWLIESILKSAGYRCGVIGTINSRFNDTKINTGYTTPDAILLQQTLRQMKDQDVTHVVMEVSSHGLELHRVDGCDFNTAVFTNLTRDHLDFHGNMERYFASKKRLFTDFLGSRSSCNAPAVINIDHDAGRKMAQEISCDLITTGKNTSAGIHADAVMDDIHGLAGKLVIQEDAFPFKSILTGGFNLENILCAAGAAHAVGISGDVITAGIEACRTVPGRLEKIENTLERHLFVDYAHTPDALESVLQTLCERAPARIITVFGCGGDRDRTKRPLMGQAACRLSDIAVVTSDNPRSEAPHAIIDDITVGLEDFNALSPASAQAHPGKKGYLVIEDRSQAISTALELSKAGDIILVAGKGHETYQILNDKTIDFDDREHLAAAAREMEKGFVPLPWRLEDLSEALETDPASSTLPENKIFGSISTDSRTIQPGQVFVALKGDRFDAHDFIPDLIQKGICCFVVEKGFATRLEKNLAHPESGLALFEVSSTLSALGLLARFHRRRNPARVLALTGSSGKTTTRAILQSIFETRFHTLATKGNLNNEIGVPLTLLQLAPRHEWAIIEMGMNHPGEMGRLSRIAVPDTAIVLNTAGAHLEGLGTVENVAKAKSEIFEGVNHAATAVIPADDPRRMILEDAAGQNPEIKKILFFGSDNDADLRLAATEYDGSQTVFTAAGNQQERRFTIASPARFMVNNALAAICAADAAGIDTGDIQAGLSRFTPAPGRLNILSLNGQGHLIDDTYNANPESMGQALETLSRLSRGKAAIAVLGDMLELGQAAARLHEEIGKKAAGLGVSKLYLHGTLAADIQKGALAAGLPQAEIFLGDKKKIAAMLAGQLNNETWVLVKGSRGMAMETIIQDLKQILTQTA